MIHADGHKTKTLSSMILHFFLNLFLIGDELLHNIVMVSAIHQYQFLDIPTATSSLHYP